MSEEQGIALIGQIRCERWSEPLWRRIDILRPESVVHREADLNDIVHWPEGEIKHNGTVLQDPLRNR